MNCKPGVIGFVNSNTLLKENIGIFVEVIRQYRPGEILPGNPSCYENKGELGWVVRALGANLLVCNLSGNYLAELAVFKDKSITPFRDQPGNESFVVEARKSLPRTKDSPVRINERGELA